MVKNYGRANWDGQDLLHQLKQYDRTPFHDLLAEFLECAPTADAIQKFANKYPDRWAGAMRQIAQMAGFTEKRELAINLNVHEMSDSQLEDMVRNFLIEKSINLPANEISATEPILNIPKE